MPVVVVWLDKGRSWEVVAEVECEVSPVVFIAVLELEGELSALTGMEGFGSVDAEDSIETIAVTGVAPGTVLAYNVSVTGVDPVFITDVRTSRFPVGTLTELSNVVVDITFAILSTNCQQRKKSNGWRRNRKREEKSH